MERSSRIQHTKGSEDLFDVLCSSDYGRLLAVHAASGSSLPVYRNMFYRALSNTSELNGTEPMT